MKFNLSICFSTNQYELVLMLLPLLCSHYRIEHIFKCIIYFFLERFSDDHLGPGKKRDLDLTKEEIHKKRRDILEKL